MLGDASFAPEGRLLDLVDDAWAKAVLDIDEVPLPAGEAAKLESEPGPLAGSAPQPTGDEWSDLSLLPVAAPLWPQLSLALAAQLGSACVFLATPAAFGRVLDAVALTPTAAAAAAAASASASPLPGALACLGLLYAGQCAASYAVAVTTSAAADGLGLRLRCAGFAAALAQDAAFFDASASGELASRLGADAACVASAAGAAARLVRAALEAAGALVVLSLTSPAASLVALGAAPAAVVLSSALGARVRALSRSSSAALAEAAGCAAESFAHARTLKSFTQEGAAVGAYARRARRAYRLQTRVAAHLGALEAATRAAGNACAVAILGLGGRLVASGALTLGQLTSLVIYVLFLASAAGGVAACWGELQRAEGAGARLFALLRRRPSVAGPPAPAQQPPAQAQQPQMQPAPAAAAAGWAAALRSAARRLAATGAGARAAAASPPLTVSPPPPPPPPLLRPGPLRVALRGVSFRYPGRGSLALCNVDLELAPGRVTALVGPSGSGKSTVAALLQRFYDPEGGAVLLDGADVRGHDPAWLRAHVAVVSQEPALFDATVADNIALGGPGGRPPPTRAQVVAAATAANAHAFITAFPSGYDTRLGERGVQLSGGQRQRLAIARALLKDAPVLVLDEATSALDMESEGAVQEALERLCRGRTTLVIAHRFAALRGASTIVVMDGGRVVERGSHAQLVAANGLYASMYRLGRFAGGPAGQVGRLAGWAAGVPALLASRLGRRLEERARNAFVATAR